MKPAQSNRWVTLALDVGETFLEALAMFAMLAVAACIAPFYWLGMEIPDELWRFQHAAPRRDDKIEASKEGRAMSRIAKMKTKWIGRLGAIFDGSAWLLIAPAFLAIYFMNEPMALTLVQWGLFGIVIAGVAIMVSRLIFPDIKLRELVDLAETGNTAAAHVAIALIAFVLGVMAILVYWAKN